MTSLSASTSRSWDCPWTLNIELMGEEGGGADPKQLDIKLSIFVRRSVCTFCDRSMAFLKMPTYVRLHSRRGSAARERPELFTSLKHITKLTIWIANPSSIQAQSSETYYKTNHLACQSKLNPSPIQAQSKPNVENILCFQQFGRADLRRSSVDVPLNDLRRAGT